MTPSTARRRPRFFPLPVPINPISESTAPSSAPTTAQAKIRKPTPNDHSSARVPHPETAAPAALISTAKKPHLANQEVLRSLTLPPLGKRHDHVPLARRDRLDRQSYPSPYHEQTTWIKDCERRRYLLRARTRH